MQRRASLSSSRWVTQTAQSQLRHDEDSTNSTSNERIESHPQSLRLPQVAQPTLDEKIVHPQGPRTSAPLSPHVSVSSETKVDRTLQPVSSPGDAKTGKAPQLAMPIASAGQAHLVPALRTDRAAVLPTSPQAAPPIVRVTIGRVDVHAIMPPLPTPRPAPARRAAPLSLDKYLKQVNGQR